MALLSKTRVAILPPPSSGAVALRSRSSEVIEVRGYRKGTLLKASAPAGETIPISGCDLYYETRGDGEPLVLLHGGCELEGMFKEPSGGYRLIVPDLRATATLGGSERRPRSHLWKGRLAVQGDIPAELGFDQGLGVIPTPSAG
jgi:hypothetical protein